ncbi:MAG: hypothetical protein KKB70_10365 [Proteobacteria bacterium]|nr:hypothetical protein [Pseudomonadota bacterium]
MKGIIENGFLVVGDEIFYLNGCICLRNNKNLSGLPDGLHVKESLDLAGCTDLTALPDGLIVGGNLWLEGCTGLVSLPDGLQVGGFLGLDGCTGITSLPDDLQVSDGVLGFAPKPTPGRSQAEPGVVLDDEALAWLTTRADGGWIV